MRIYYIILIAISFSLYNIHFITFAESMDYATITSKILKEFKCYSIPINYKEIEVHLREETAECRISGDLLQELNVKAIETINCITGKLGKEGCTDILVSK